MTDFPTARIALWIRADWMSVLDGFYLFFLQVSRIDLEPRGSVNNTLINLHLRNCWCGVSVLALLCAGYTSIASAMSLWGKIESRF